MPDVLTEPLPRGAFRGGKPQRWTHWVLEALTFNPLTDKVDDLFPGSGAVQQAVSTFGFAEPAHPSSDVLEGQGELWPSSPVTWRSV